MPNPIDKLMIENAVLEQIQTVFDPEIPVNIYELGLIYDVDVNDEGKVSIQMTLTSPACPAAQSLPGEVETKVRGVEGVTDLDLQIVWEPAWTMDRMSEAAKLELGFF